ncbi:MAG: PRC-barrel domain-containing protein [Methylocystaceae bacterium]
MLCAKQLTGWPVFDSEGKELGRVEHLVVTEGMKLAGILINRGSEGMSLAGIEDTVIGDHLVWLASSSCFKLAHSGEESPYNYLLGKEVVDINGKVSGIAHDFVLDPTQKSIVGLELSDGLVLDWLQGRQVAAVGSLEFDGQRWISAVENQEGAGNTI